MFSNCIAQITVNTRNAENDYKSLNELLTQIYSLGTISIILKAVKMLTYHPGKSKLMTKIRTKINTVLFL
jgi:hypothetical protein